MKTSKLDNGSLNYLWSYQLINYFSACGVSQAVISPGSRSTPLALACERHPNIQTWVQIDERSGAFYALGLSLKGRQQEDEQQPTLLICTSGSAATHWFPAIVEAEHSYTPLLLLSADRPCELQLCGANQTIDQKNLFGTHVVDFISLKHADENLLSSDYLQKVAHTAYQRSFYPKTGVVHINIPFREPLVPSITKIDTIKNLEKNNLANKIIHKQIIADDSKLAIINIINSGQGIIVCGRLSHNEQIQFAQLLKQLTKKLNCPILLDPLSNLRFFSPLKKYAIINYDHFLNPQLNSQLDSQLNSQSKISALSLLNSQLKPDWIIRFGTFPLSKNLMEFLKQLNSQVILINSFDQRLDPIKKTKHFIHCLPSFFCKTLLQSQLQQCPSMWLKKWKTYEQLSETIINHLVKENSQLTQGPCFQDHVVKNKVFEGHVIETLLKTIPDKSLIFSGNSMAIRDFDTFITHQSVRDKTIEFYANRGTSGIDGNISTFLGLLCNHNGYGIAMLGDLSFYHDMNGLLICRELALKGYNASIIIINNSGGGIFNYLPQNKLDEFSRLWNTDTQLDFKFSAQLYGLNYYKIETINELETLFTMAFKQSGIVLIEVIIDQQISLEYHQNLNINWINKHDME